MNKGLVLARKTGESCVCTIDGKELVVLVEEIACNRVRLRFIADRSIDIVRSELVGGDE